MSLAQPSSPSGAPGRFNWGLISVFGSTLFQLSGIFMLAPWLLLILKSANVSTTVAGFFAATTWLGVFVITPFASALTQQLGRRPAMWLASVAPVLAAVGFLVTDVLWIWFVLQLLAGIAGGLRWVLAEAFIAEFAPPAQIGKYIGTYATMVGLTFVIGPAALAWVGASSPYALWVVIALLAIGLAWTAVIPQLPPDHDTHTAQVGLQGLWHAVLAHPIIMLAGFLGGFFELGLASILPLYGLALGHSDSTAALLVSASGLGGALTALPAGMVADRFASPTQGRRTMMAGFTALIFLACIAVLAVPYLTSLVWPVVFAWGAAGGALYTLAMIDIGAREKGITLVNSTAVLVLTYTLGGLVASAASGALIQWSPALAFPIALIGIAGLGVATLVKTQRKTRLSVDNHPTRPLPR
ncbi:MFS transporter [Rhodoferax sp. PAMC 29310]|uniref:MFS transporter n=1 Tax=Rhodoferax sp. PAMC 29310 TaxID=2822760 RepID=UPI001B33EB9F|nr:MFS transporter [Rhodoferax sp. PAMC 29310]